MVTAAVSCGRKEVADFLMKKGMAQL